MSKISIIKNLGENYSRRENKSTILEGKFSIRFWEQSFWEEEIRVRQNEEEIDQKLIIECTYRM